jgi:hypothetical protein
MPLELQTNFAAGELSPSIQGFINLKEYQGGLLTMENFLPDNNGGATFRQGTYYAANTAGNNQAVLLPFIFNKTDAYVLEFSNLRLRFYTQNGQEQVTFAVSNATWSSGTATVTCGTHCFLAGDTVTVSGITPSGYNGTFTLTAVTATTVKYTVANPGSYTSGGQVQGAYQLVTPYTLAPNSVTQVEDLMYMADGKHPIQVLTRLGAANWTIAPLTTVCGPFKTPNSAAGATMSVSGNTLTNAANIFASTDVGRPIIVFDSTGSSNGSAGSWKWGYISTYHSATSVDIDQWRQTTAGRTTNVSYSAGLTISNAVFKDNAITFTVGVNSIQPGMKVVVASVSPSGYNGTYTVNTRTGNHFTVSKSSDPGAYSSGGTVNSTSTADWALGAWSDTTGYPTCVCFHQERLVAGGATSDSSLQATVFNGSVIGLFDTFAPFDPDGTVNPDNAYQLQIASGRADGIKWIESAPKFLAIGTGAAEYIVSSQGPAITPTDFDVQQQTVLGSSGLQPVCLSYRLLVPQRGNYYLHDWMYNWQIGSFRSELINKQADHVMKPSVVDLDYQLNPVPTAWMTRSDGQAVTATETSSDWAFARQVLGGSFSSGAAVVESITVIPTATYDQVWFAVKRTINGQTVRFVEYLSSPFGGTMNGAYFMDAGLSYSGSATTTVTGLSHLEGQTVAVICNGVPQANMVVSGGQLTGLPSSTKISVGLPYTGTLQSLQVSNQELQGRLQTATRVFLRLYQTYGGYLLTGQNYTTQAPIPESAGTLYTGSARILLNRPTDTELHVYVQQVSPNPMSILNMSLDFTGGAS